MSLNPKWRFYTTAFTNVIFTSKQLQDPGGLNIFRLMFDPTIKGLGRGWVWAAGGFGRRQTLTPLWWDLHLWRKVQLCVLFMKLLPPLIIFRNNVLLFIPFTTLKKFLEWNHYIYFHMIGHFSHKDSPSLFRSVYS